MKKLYWLSDLFIMAYKGYEELWWDAYDWFERVVLGRAEEFRRLTYGDCWPDFKKFGLRLGNLALISDRGKYLVAGIGAKKQLLVSPIQFRNLESPNEEAYFHEDFLANGRAVVLRHFPLHVMRQLKERLEALAVASVAPSESTQSFK